LVLIDQQRQVLRAVRDKLTPPLDNHCLHASLDEGKLTLVTDSPAWASRLRFFAPDLIGALGLGFGRIEECRIRVQPPRSMGQGGQGLGGEMNAPRLSPATARLLLDAADAQGETDLGRALRRLAVSGGG
jgi:hypothetical protein